MAKERKRTVQIGARRFDFRFNKKIYGASFDCSKVGTGRGEIVIGTKDSDLTEIADCVIHECLEAILAEDRKRFYSYGASHVEPDFTFVFDHDYFSQFTHKAMNALLSSGFFKLVDGRDDKK